jgi:hypothetical protein
MLMASRLVFSLLLVSGCIIGDTDDRDCTGGKCDGDGDSCNDPRYGNGTCDLRLECAAPDIDCFDTFADDAAAATWFGMFEEKLAEEEGRPPRRFLTPADPRWAKTRELVDRGWAAFRESRAVGELRDKRPGLVMLEDPTPNAFVAPNITFDKAGFTVMVQTGLFEIGGTDDGALGVMMHEFQHVIGLHVIGDTRDRLRKFYFASQSSEPLGRFETDDAVARRYGESWRTLAGSVGMFYDPRLRALPLGGVLVQVLQAAVAQAGTAQGPACMTALTAVGAIKAEVAATLDQLTGTITVDASVPNRVDQAFANMKSACFGSFAVDVIGVMAMSQGVTPAMIEAALAPEDIALVKGKHVVDGFVALMLDRRAKMRQLESDLASKVGKQWVNLRYFSDEEDADDVSVIVLRAANIKPPHAIGSFLTGFLPADAKARCADLLARSEVPPYGHDLTDEHHGYCWRADHTRRLAEHLAGDAATAPRALTPAAQMPSFAAPRPLPLKRPLREYLSD